MKITKIEVKEVSKNLNELFERSVLNVDCGEIPGSAVTTTVCLLGSLNLTQYVNKDRTFNWNLYERDVRVFTRMLDNVIELHNTDLPAYLWSVKNARQFGMGVNGFGSTLFMLGYGYDSKEGLDFAEKINRIKLNTCLKSSAELAKEKGKASLFNEKYFETNYWKEFLKGKLDKETIEIVLANGVRNTKVTTNAPLGNCVSIDTEILTEEGVKTIKQIFEENEIDLKKEKTWNIPIKEIKVQTLEGYKRITGLYVNTKEDNIKIKTKTGQTLKGTKKHKVLVKLNDEQAIWKEIGALKVGEKILSIL